MMTMQDEWLRAYVEKCLASLWDGEAPSADRDGDYPYRWGTAACWVRVEPGDLKVVRVFSHAVEGVKRTGRLLAELNDVSARARTAQVFWRDGAVVVQQALHAEGVTSETLGHACAAVGIISDDIGGLVSSVYGGETPFPADEACAGCEDA